MAKLVVALLLLALPSLFAQAQDPSFEVIAIHTSPNLDTTKGIIDYRGTNLRAQTATVHFLLKFAFQLRDHQLGGGPDWIRTATYDIDAGPITTNVQQTQRMLQTMLTDRFKLRSHREVQTQTIYRLVESKNGSKLRAEGDGAKTSFRALPGSGSIEATAIPLSTLVTLLVNELGHSVTDDTKLPGRYSFQLRYAPGLDTQPESNAASLFTAIEEQLGLRLESARGPVEVLVIDGIEMPSEN